MFRPTGIEHVLLNVTDPKRSAAFYETIFGPGEGLWFRVGQSRIGLVQNAKPGVYQVGISAGAPAELTDPNGLRIQVL
jgi:predicted enzyme related to lactoylglutathione lyase